MIWEELDHLKANCKINDAGEVWQNDHLLIPSTDSRDNVVVYIDRHRHNLAKLVAEMFIPNPHGYKYIGYKNGNKFDCRASNLQWCPNKKRAEFMQADKRMDKVEARKIRMAIHDAVEDNNWTLATELGKLLPFGEEDAVRPMLVDYPKLDPSTRMKTSSPILRVWTVEDGTLDYCSTKEVTEKYNVKPSTVYQRYTNPPKRHVKGVIYLDLVAMVSKYFVNAQIDIFKDSKRVATQSYTATCQIYNIHLEDLVDLLYSNDDDIITYKGLEFRMADGQNKAPAQHGKEV